jgi:hypothetical protein
MLVSRRICFVMIQLSLILWSCLFVKFVPLMWMNAVLTFQTLFLLIVFHI